MKCYSAMKSAKSICAFKSHCVTLSVCCAMTIGVNHMFCSKVVSAEYFVAAGGDDTGMGSDRSPWRTIQRAVNVMKPGDTVWVGDGNYNERVQTAVDGMVDLPVAIRATGESATLSGLRIAHNHHAVSGFRITGQGVPAYQGSITIEKSITGLLLAHNVFIATPSLVGQVLSLSLAKPTECNVVSNRFVDANYHALSLGGGFHRILANTYTSTTGWDAIRLIASNCKIASNTFTNWSNLTSNANHADLIQSFEVDGHSATNNIIERNFAINCVGTQIGNLENNSGLAVVDWVWQNNIFIGIEGAINIAAKSVKFYNNAFVKSGVNTVGVILFRDVPGRVRADNGEVVNNAFIECGMNPENPGQGWYVCDGKVTGIIADCNLVVGRGLGFRKIKFKDSGREVRGVNGMQIIIGASILPTSLDTATASLGGRGMDLSAKFKDDYFGKARSGLWSIGPFHYIVDPVNPAGYLKVR